MKKILLTLIILMYSLASKGQRNDDWVVQYTNYTPYNNIIDAYGAMPCLSLRTDDRYNSKTPKEYDIAFCGLSEWYFYGGAIVGTTSNDYFVVFEKTSRIHQFNSKEKWESFIQENNLKPAIWTRWYDGDWKKSILNTVMNFLKGIMTIFLFILIYSPFLAIIVLLFFAILFGFLIKSVFSEMYQENFSPRKLVSKSFYIIIGGILMSIILDQLLITYPQSF